jgi:peptide/nickel transport system substrate-binding protein
VRDWVEGSHIVLDAFDDYVFGRPRIDEIVVRFIPDGNAMVANILAGEVDLILERGLSLDQAMQIRQSWAGGRVEFSTDSWVAAYPQHIDPSPPIVADPRFKRALLHAADRQEMVDTIMQGVTEVAHAMVKEGDAEYPFVKDRIVRYEYDPTKAVQMIEGLGYTKGADGMFRDAAGQILSIEGRAGGGSDAYPPRG